MHLIKWLGGAAVGLGLMVAGSSAFAVTIGFSQVGDEGDWRPAFSKDMQEEAKKEGIDLKFADAQGKEEEQLKAVRVVHRPEGRRHHHRAGGRHRLGSGARRGQEGAAFRFSSPIATSMSPTNPSLSPAFRPTSTSRDGSPARGSPKRARATATSSSCKAPSARRRRSSARRASRPIISQLPEHEDRQDPERQLHHRRRQEGDGGLHQVDRQPQGHLRRVRAQRQHAARRHPGDEGSRPQARQGLPDGVGRLRSGDEGSARGRATQTPRSSCARRSANTSIRS